MLIRLDSLVMLCLLNLSTIWCCFDCQIDKLKFQVQVFRSHWFQAGVLPVFPVSKIWSQLEMIRSFDWLLIQRHFDQIFTTQWASLRGKSSVSSERGNTESQLISTISQLWVTFADKDQVTFGIETSISQSKQIKISVTDKRATDAKCMEIE